MKKTLSLLLALLILAAHASAERAGLPAFVYRGEDPYTAAVCDWTLARSEDLYAGADVAIPAPLLLEVDDADPGDVRVWGCFSLYNYRLLNTTLFCESGGTDAGLLHLAATGDGFTVVSVDAVGDGDDYDDDVRRIFGMREGLAEKYANAEGAREEARLEFIGDYARWNGLPVTQYQDFGWPPVALPGAASTEEADQIVRYASPLGYGVDYDLRAFSRMGFDDVSEGLCGVGALEGASLFVERRADQGAEDAAAELAAGLAQPVRETATLGAAGLEALRVRDAGLRAGVDHSAYVVPLQESGCLVLTVSNTRYAAEDAEVVPGADAALAALLEAFRLE